MDATTDVQPDNCTPSPGQPCGAVASDVQCKVALTLPTQKQCAVARFECSPSIIDLVHSWTCTLLYTDAHMQLLRAVCSNPSDPCSSNGECWLCTMPAAHLPPSFCKYHVPLPMQAYQCSYVAHSTSAGCSAPDAQPPHGDAGARCCGQHRQRETSTMAMAACCACWLPVLVTAAAAAAAAAAATASRRSRIWRACIHACTHRHVASPRSYGSAQSRTGQAAAEAHASINQPVEYMEHLTMPTAGGSRIEPGSCMWLSQWRVFNASS